MERKPTKAGTHESTIDSGERALPSSVRTPLLAVAALRDGDTEQATAILRYLSREFPSNHLYAQELSKIASHKNTPHEEGRHTRRVQGIVQNYQQGFGPEENGYRSTETICTRRIRGGPRRR